MRKFLYLIMLFLTLAGPAIAADSVETNNHQVFFQTEVSAQQTCPRDSVVWVNTQTMVYHYRGMRWYGATRDGAFMCERDRNLVGARPTRNGQ